MKYRHFAVLALSIATSAAEAQGVSPFSDESSRIEPWLTAASHQYDRAAPNGSLVSNSNQCAPDIAEPQWSSRALLGYACRSPSANGS